MVMGEFTQETDLLVIGGGPGGYAAAFRAADLGMDVTMVEIGPQAGRSMPVQRLYPVEDPALRDGTHVRCPALE